ncbi:MAG: hypothetical protein CMH64_04135 [Nanoarchaeota archaeon]|nr:hypothetical protein [Nanoarchaeota archaeon]
MILKDKKLLKDKKIYYQNPIIREKQKQNQRERRKRIPEIVRLSGRIAHFRRRQGKLAQQELKFNGYKPYINGLDVSFSTFGL